MFNEGYSSTNNADAIRSDVCEDAARLCHMLTKHPYCSTRTTFALLALMLFHASRFESRIDHAGALVLLEDQDRQTWDRRMMSRANDFLNEATKYGASSNYHLEAAIAMHHCRAACFEETDWSAIIELYDHLIRINESSIYQLNRAVAIGQRDGPTAAIMILEQIQDDPVFKNLHLLEATLGDLYRRKGDSQTAVRFFETAIKKTTSQHDQELLRRRIAQCR